MESCILGEKAAIELAGNRKARDLYEEDSKSEFQIYHMGRSSIMSASLFHLFY